MTLLCSALDLLSISNLNLVLYLAIITIRSRTQNTEQKWSLCWVSMYFHSDIQTFSPTFFNTMAMVINHFGRCTSSLRPRQETGNRLPTYRKYSVSTSYFLFISVHSVYAYVCDRKKKRSATGKPSAPPLN